MQWRRWPDSTPITVCPTSWVVKKSSISNARSSLGDQWPELLGVLFQASQSPEAGLREAAFRIFSTTPSIIEKNHEDAVSGVFGKGFKDDVVTVCCDLSA